MTGDRSMILNIVTKTIYPEVPENDKLNGGLLPDDQSPVSIEISGTLELFYDGVAWCDENDFYLANGGQHDLE